MLNWIVWKRTVYLSKNGFGINLQKLICHKTPNNQPTIFFNEYNILVLSHLSSYCIGYSLLDLFTLTRTDEFLQEYKRQQVSRTLLSILTDYCSAVVWMFSLLSRISWSSNLLSKFLGLFIIIIFSSPIYQPPPLRQDMTQGQFLSGV